MTPRLVTLRSASKAINHVSLHNGPGRLAEATAMLEEITPSPEAREPSLTHAYAEGRKDEREALSAAARDVLAERERQIAIGYDHAHDDEHANGEIANAAADWLTTGQAPSSFSWAVNKGKKDRRTQLVIGAAMALAEIERMDRAAIASVEGKS